MNAFPERKARLSRPNGALPPTLISTSNILEALESNKRIKLLKELVKCLTNPSPIRLTLRLLDKRANLRPRVIKRVMRINLLALRCIERNIDSVFLTNLISPSA